MPIPISIFSFVTLVFDFWKLCPIFQHLFLLKIGYFCDRNVTGQNDRSLMASNWFSQARSHFGKRRRDQSFMASSPYHFYVGMEHGTCLNTVRLRGQTLILPTKPRGFQVFCESDFELNRTVLERASVPQPEPKEVNQDGRRCDRVFGRVGAIAVGKRVLLNNG